MEQSLGSAFGTQPLGRQGDSSFGVQSLADTLEAAFGPESTTVCKRTESNPNPNPKHHDKVVSRSGSHSSSASSGNLPDSSKLSPTRRLKRKLSSHASTTPLTPLNVDAPSPLPTSGMPSTPSAISLQSLKLSDEDSLMDESASQAVMSSGEEEEAETTTQQDFQSSFPQLVMPSIQMPSRRPFTTKGKAMGKLRVMVAGETGMSLYPITVSYSRNTLLTVYHRHRKDVSRTLHSPTLRRYCTRRSFVSFQSNHPATATQTKVSPQELRTCCDH
jgi:hypothetical protein